MPVPMQLQIKMGCWDMHLSTNTLMTHSIIYDLFWMKHYAQKFVHVYDNCKPIQLKCIFLLSQRNGKTISNHKRHESVNHGEFRIAKPIIGYIKSIIVIDSTTPSIRPWSRLGTSYNAIFGVSCTPCMLAPNGIIFYIIPYKISLWSALMYGCWIFNIRVISCKHSIYKFW